MAIIATLNVIFNKDLRVSSSKIITSKTYRCA
ncbi:hypothetical protein CPS_4159 [Colwellia psychrerythraea 34H]|uniref:Uncharacterized protein n=1 Tax=Colwellia psychrerythraea (strain 34H / ATCC BAA-681) TaxID=167879 RepID=Q47WL1_COLP3|nr:hypothetical protein CPS_4159 [Colwellia psychrerythraea 34H]